MITHDTVDPKLSHAALVHAVEELLIDFEKERYPRTPVRKLIEQGVAMNPENPEDKSAIDLLLSRSILAHPETEKYLSLLIKHGANPLAGKTPALDYSVVKYATAGWEAVFSELISHEAKGRGMRSEDGGNIFHLLAGMDTLKTAVFLETHIAEVIMGNEPLIPVAIFKEQRHCDGATPLHVLWTHAAEEFQRQRADNRTKENTAYWAWRTTKALMCAGCDLHAQDFWGVSAGEKMLALVDQGFPLGEETEALIADTQRQHLDQQTASTGVASRRPVRI